MIQTDLIADALDELGWAILREFVPIETWRALAAEVHVARVGGGLRAAGVGAGQHYRLAGDVRGDQIQWLEAAPASVPQQDALSRLDALRRALNSELQLGLFEFEGHYALYPPGAGYRRHHDQHRGSKARVLSCVLYLNSDWKAEDEGQLRLYVERAGAGNHYDVLPEGGKLVCFLSDRFWHEVLPARRERLSLTGWFRRRS